MAPFQSQALGLEDAGSGIPEPSTDAGLEAPRAVTPTPAQVDIANADEQPVDTPIESRLEALSIGTPTYVPVDLANADEQPVDTPIDSGLASTPTAVAVSAPPVQAAPPPPFQYSFHVNGDFGYNSGTPFEMSARVAHTLRQRLRDEDLSPPEIRHLQIELYVRWAAGVGGVWWTLEGEEWFVEYEAYLFRNGGRENGFDYVPVMDRMAWFRGRNRMRGAAVTMADALRRARANVGVLRQGRGLLWGYLRMERSVMHFDPFLELLLTGSGRYERSP